MTIPADNSQARKSPPDVHDGSDPAARAARRKRSDRITVIVIIVMLAGWGLALYFHRELRANYWALRIAWAKDDEQRDQWIRNLSYSGRPAEGATLRLTRSGDPEIRLVGMRILLTMVRESWIKYCNSLQKPARPGQMPDPTAPEPPPFKVSPAITARLRQLLDDSSPPVQLATIEGLVLVGDRGSVGRLVELAHGTAHPAVAVRAASALADLEPSERTAEMLREILRRAASPDVRAQAVDSLAFAPTPATLQAMVHALDDVREVTIRPRSDQFNADLLAAVRRELLRQNLPVELWPGPASQPTTEPERMTVADYADRTLRMMTGQDCGFDARAPEADRKAAIERWRALLPKMRTHGGPSPHGPAASQADPPPGEPSRHGAGPDHPGPG